MKFYGAVYISAQEISLKLRIIFTVVPLNFTCFEFPSLSFLVQLLLLMFPFSEETKCNESTIPIVNQVAFGGYQDKNTDLYLDFFTYTVQRL